MSVTLIVDYSNGRIRTIANLPHDPDLFVVLAAAASGSPPLEFEFEAAGSDRGGREMGSIVSVDRVGAETEGTEWRLWVNGSYGESELRRPVPHMPADFSQPQVEDGDTLLLKLTG